jgi:osmotically-inducible protein OsmY
LGAERGFPAHDGVVTLNGHVQNFSQKLAAEKAAARVKGVKAVAEEIEVKLPFDIKRGDEDIASAAIERLARDSSVPRDAVKVRAGWVTLSGAVEWHYQTEAAAQNIRVLHGVVSVSNQLGIKPTVDTANVRDDITSALHRSWFYDPNTIKVTAKGSKIKLTGDVTSWSARDLAETRHGRVRARPPWKTTYTSCPDQGPRRLGEPSRRGRSTAETPPRPTCPSKTSPTEVSA